MIKNTSKMDDGDRALLLSAGMDGNAGAAVELQESRGQRELVASTSLPTDTCGTDADFTAAGFAFGEPDPGDPLFRPATLPPGWVKVATDHSMWTEIRDALGRKRVGVFYKAAFYDRRAHMRLSSPQDYLCGCLDDGTVPVLDDAWLTADVVAQELAAMPDYYRDAAETLRLRLAADTPERPA